jgi:hypothetical protein
VLADSDRPAGEDLGAQPAAMDERSEHLLAVHLDEVQAGPAQADAAADQRAELELPADEV